MTDFYDLTDDEQGVALRSLAEAACKCWAFATRPELTLLKNRENAVFRLDVGSEKYALRVHRAGYHSPTELESELRWMADLRTAGIDTPEIVVSRSGRLFESVSVDSVPEERLVDVLTWVTGEPMGTVGGGLATGDTTAVFKDSGRLMAKLHNHAQTWKRPAGFERHSWDVDGLLGADPVWGRFWELEALDREQRTMLLAVRKEAKSALESFGYEPDRYGLIHADFLPENLLVTDGSVQLIDFDDAGFGWHLFDIATSLFVISDAPNFEENLNSFVEGYRSQRELPDSHLAQLPLFLLLRGLAYLGWLHTRSETSTAKAMTPFLVPIVTQAAAEYLNGIK